ncbi:DUF262 domain-containing protein [Shewanella baltica]|uniref:GmrSD restriction endonucleases N-terminal domain-containing protein n=1 Tax=Shewanella baltica (strain OS155 / ATCC BAA-1091) TaxID=325240 RepID=A3D7Y7_SHEB5|nr:DUF262 domain-containing protein [Shewanella baltica]ABN62850.1 protein of unknown function DUF262 [Shewanella baltica OS155]AEH15189.1 protein of unknown function DUF262 [Shewanella baltica OS117]
MSNVEEQIKELKKEVSFDTRDFTIEIIVQKYNKGLDNDENEIFVPDYQRDFVWDEERQSKMVESIILGLPIPSIFVAEDVNGRLEIVDGSQRIRTLSAFINEELVLKELSKVTSLNGKKFSELDESRKRKFNNTAISMIVLSEETSPEMRNDLFERINKGSDILRGMEVRKGIYTGGFTDFLYSKCSNNTKFRSMIKLSSSVRNRQEYEELILRFFAISEKYPKYSTFSRNVGSALDDYIKDKNFNFTVEEERLMLANFNSMVNFVHDNFLFGFSKNEGKETSRMFFEALSVGTHLALKEKPRLELRKKVDAREWLNDYGFKCATMGKYRTHSTVTLRSRVDFVMGKLLFLSR